MIVGIAESVIPADLCLTMKSRSYERDRAARQGGLRGESSPLQTSHRKWQLRPYTNTHQTRVQTDTPEAELSCLRSKGGV